MKTHSSYFKNGINKLGRQLRSKITYVVGEEVIELGNSQLNSIEQGFETSLLKSVMKFIEIDSNVEIPVGITFKYELGLKEDRYIETSDTNYFEGKNYFKNQDGVYVLLVAGIDYEIGDEITSEVFEYQEYEYVNFGNYIVKDIEVAEDTNSYKIKAYDKMLYAMKNYEAFVTTYPITIRDYIIALCNKLNLGFANASDDFVNYDKEIPNELYLSNDGGSLDYTYRDVLDQLAEVTASNICINANDQLEIRYVNNTNDIIDETYLKDINVKFGETYGPINTIVLSRSAGADNIYLQDDQSVEENGVCEFKITDNQIMNFNDRDTYLPEILNQLKGLEFSINDFESTGIAYYDVCDKYNVSIGGENYTCVMLNDDISITQGIQESIYTDSPENSNTDYTKADKTDRRINQAYIIVDKQNQVITEYLSKTDTLVDEMGNVYTKQDIDEIIQDVKTGWTQNFIKKGGTNLFRNTGLWFGNQDENTRSANPYEFWTGRAGRVSEDKAVNLNAISLKDDTFSQSIVVPNGNYTVSFKYKKLNELVNTSVKINGTEYELTETTDTDFYTGKKDMDGNYVIPPLVVSSQQIKVEFISDADDECIVYDLMVNSGESASTYEQNQNETTTDTVNISKGITITSTDIPTTFKANADGVRIYANSDLNNAKTTFTDKGITTKELIAEDKAQITGLLFQKIGSQVWISKL